MEIGTCVGDRRGVDVQRLCVCPTCVPNSNACAGGPALWGGAWQVAGGTLHPLVLLFALSGSLMISRIRIPKL